MGYDPAAMGSNPPIIRLYHGSDVAIERPDVSLNTGFSDLGQGFYLTDDHEAARKRARTRARITGNGTGIVSVFGLDEACVPWVTADEGASTDAPFGVRFDESQAGIVAWIDYIKACRAGQTGWGTAGEPSIVRCWIATEEVELACSGLISPAELAEFVAPDELTVQYCLRDQAIIDEHLTFIEAESLGQ